MSECALEDCRRAPYSRGLCYKHYNEQRAETQPLCSVLGCVEPRRGQQLYCERHYRKERAKVAPECSVVGCTHPVVARGLCDAHRKREDRHGHLDPTRPADSGGKDSHPLTESYRWLKRKNELCDEWKQDFWKFVHDLGGDRPSPTHRIERHDRSLPHSKENSFWREKIMVSGENRREYQRNYSRAHRKKNPDYYRNFYLKKRFGIDIDEYSQKLESQDGLCAICKQEEKSLDPRTEEIRLYAVDHDHATGAVRGLLCINCNLMIGNAQDDISIMEAGIAYLKKYGL